jgi:hypothetical protein
MRCMLAALTLVPGVLAQGIAEEAQSAMSTPRLAVRELYAPAHFGNSYEVMGEREMREYLEEAIYWGFNRYADWFDMIDCSDPFADPHHNLAHALWERKRANFRSAQSLGLPCDLTITPNHVYADQCLPELAAQKTGRIFGQLICPSRPQAREIILRNYERLFADLAQAGVRLSGICPGPYDYGGCACDDCEPWILTFAQLMREICAIAERHHPGIEAHFVGWWWSEEEHRLFAEWADREAPGWVKSIYLHVPYGATDVSDVPLPSGCERRAFVHIGYAEQANPRDVYGHLGPVIAADRLARTIADLEAHGCTGWMAYSEGVSDDVNKALLAGLSAGRFEDAHSVLAAYAARYFGAPPQAAERWADWLEPWGRPFEVKVEKAAETLLRLVQSASESAWRLEQWEAKTALVRLHNEIGSGEEWSPERLAKAEEFWATQERLQREVWGLGPIRHVLARRFTPLPWYKSWAQYQSQHVQELGLEQ